jgi:hypothetical protein
MDPIQRPPNVTAYATMDKYYEERFAAYRNIGKEKVFGGADTQSGYRRNVETNNYPKLADLYKGQAAFYSQMCGKK